MTSHTRDLEDSCPRPTEYACLWRCCGGSCNASCTSFRFWMSTSLPSTQGVGVAQNETIGGANRRFSPCFHLPGFHFQGSLQAMFQMGKMYLLRSPDFGYCRPASIRRGGTAPFAQNPAANKGYAAGRLTRESGARPETRSRVRLADAFVAMATTTYLPQKFHRPLGLWSTSWTNHDKAVRW